MTKPKAAQAPQAACKPVTAKARPQKTRASKASAPKAAAAPAPPAEPPPPPTKLAIFTALLRRKQGATIAQMTAATGWQAHSVRAAVATTLAKTFGAKLSSQLEDGVRVYRAPKPSA